MITNLFRTFYTFSIRLSIVVAALTYTCSISAQEECKTVFQSENARERWGQIMIDFQDFRKTQAGQRITPTTVQHIPVYIHIVYNSVGHLGFHLEHAREHLARASQAFAPAYIQLYECGNSTIYSDDLNDIDSQADQDSIRTYNKPNVINLYIVNDIDGAQGYAYLPPNIKNNYNTLVMKGDAMHHTTLEHEFGHIFGLQHTHHTGAIVNYRTGDTLGGPELVNRSNCSIAGDLFCDTPADPNLLNLVTNPGCIYWGLGKDSNGDYYRPDVRNYMSYSLQSCKNSFSINQMELMYFVATQVWDGETDNEVSCAECQPGAIGFPSEIFPGDFILGEWWRHDYLYSSSSMKDADNVGGTTHLYTVATRQIKLLPGFSFSSSTQGFERFHAKISPCPVNE